MVLRVFSRDPPKKKKKNTWHFFKVGIYRQSVYVTKEYWLPLIFAIFYERNTVC